MKKTVNQFRTAVGTCSFQQGRQMTRGTCGMGSTKQIQRILDTFVDLFHNIPHGLMTVSGKKEKCRSAELMGHDKDSAVT